MHVELYTAGFLKIPLTLPTVNFADPPIENVRPLPPGLRDHIQSLKEEGGGPSHWIRDWGDHGTMKLVYDIKREMGGLDTKVLAWVKVEY